VIRLLLAAYFIDAGLLLSVAPWMPWWERNAFAGLIPDLRLWMGSPSVRVGVTAVGVLTAVAGIAELRTIWRQRMRARVTPAEAPREP